jgi:hypothetical protein
MQSVRTLACASPARRVLLIAGGLTLAACDPDKGTPTEATTDTDTAPTTDTAEAWPETIGVRVTDEDGAPVEGAVVMMGGWSAADWVTTDVAGEAAVPVVDAGTREQYLLAGKEGWFSGGTVLDFDAPAPASIEIAMRLLPDEDNPDYAFLPGGDGSSPDTSECGHCHWPIGDDWAGSAHATAASSPAVWDIYTGSASGTEDEAACVAQGGWWSEGQSPGEAGEVIPRCYLGAGVLPWLHDDCGGSAQPACDHPDQRASLAHFGSCGDCHSPAFDGATPGRIDLAAATGVAFEGVTCDFCHKVQSVNPGTSPGLDGGIELLRPSAPSVLPNLEHEPITFGPYPDVIVPIMNGTYTPQFREAEWCASCHEYAQPALHPDESTLVDTDRWPDGVPVFETFSEFSASSMSDTLNCQSCHMLFLDEESSTYDITPQGLEPSTDQGWLRELGEVRHHGFSSDGLSGPSLAIALVEVDDEIEATVTVTNAAAGHAVPTGEPMKQLLVRVSAHNGDGDGVAASGGQVIPDMGGLVLSGEIDAGVTITGAELTFDGATIEGAEGLHVRFARPTGAWDDYAGPGTAGFSSDGLTAEDKGIALTGFLGEVAVSSVDGSTVFLAGPAPATEAGDRVYLVGSDDDAGAPGWLYAKVLLDASGARGVAHYRAVSVASDNRIAPSAAGTSVHRFAAPAASESLTVEATLIRRYRGAPVADAYGWDRGDEVLSTTSETTSP